jgi:tetraacyldisaccharide 4'-kinase
MTTAGIRRLDRQSVHRETLLAQPVGAFCGVGNPESFFCQLRREGLELTFTRAFADHHNYSQAEMNLLNRDAKAHGAGGLMTTAKDASKLVSFEMELPCYVLDIQISIDDDEQLVELIRNVCRKREP